MSRRGETGSRSSTMTVLRSGFTRRSREASATSALRSDSSATTPTTRARPLSSRSEPPTPRPRSPADVVERIAVPGRSFANGSRSASGSVAAYPAGSTASVSSGIA